LSFCHFVRLFSKMKAGLSFDPDDKEDEFAAPSNLVFRKGGSNSAAAKKRLRTRTSFLEEEAPRHDAVRKGVKTDSSSSRKEDASSPGEKKRKEDESLTEIAARAARAEAKSVAAHAAGGRAKEGMSQKDEEGS
jgi:hypothetical protein